MNCLAIVIVLVGLTKASPWDDKNFTIAVVEYQPINNDTRVDRVVANTAAYKEILQSTLNLDLVIFPENALRVSPLTAVELTLFDNPCDLEVYTTFIRDLSCASRYSNSYTVVNLVHKVPCDHDTQSPNCETYGGLLYNTNVVFDRNGTIITLYHKYNLFGEKPLDRPSVPEKITIETDFGLKFGTFTCFDILFKSPAEDLVGQVDAIIYPAMWYSELPFLTALQAQQMWSYTHDTVLFASGANNPEVGSGGSGIFNGAKDPTTTFIIPKGGKSVYIFNSQETVPSTIESDQKIDQQGVDMDTFFLNIDPYVIEYASTILDNTREDISEQVCYEDQLCCNFSIKISTNSTNSGKNIYTYHMVAFSGVRSFGGTYNGGIEVCGIIACLNSSLSSCGQRFPNYEDIEWSIKFEAITIMANFDISENKTQYPNSLLSSIKPIKVSQTLWKNEEVEIDGKILNQRTFGLTEPQTRILTFAIYGRNFGLDSPPDDDETSSSQTTNTCWFIMVLTLVTTFCS